MNKLDLEPHQIVVDMVLVYSALMPTVGHAAVFNDSPHTMVLAARNHRGEFCSFSFSVYFDGEPDDGDEKRPPRFVMFKLGPNVWKVTPSISHPLLHAYLTIVGVPEPAPWETR